MHYSSAHFVSLLDSVSSLMVQGSIAAARAPPAHHARRPDRLHLLCIWRWALWRPCLVRPTPCSACWARASCCHGSRHGFVTRLLEMAGPLKSRAMRLATLMFFICGSSQPAESFWSCPLCRRPCARSVLVYFAALFASALAVLPNLLWCSATVAAVCCVCGPA